MSTFVYRDLISDKLEIARTLGLVTRYVVSPTKGANLSVRVWRHPGTSEKTITDYLGRLLDGLVSAQQIAVLPQNPADGEMPRADRVDATQIAPVSAAA